SWPRQEWIQAQGHWKQVNVPPMGYLAVDGDEADPYLAPVAEESLLENDLLRVSLAKDGSISSIYDKALCREVVPPGQSANRLAVYRDPGDAWDFPLDYAQQAPLYMSLVSARPVCDGPRATLIQTYCFEHSELVQEIALTAGSRRLEFNTRVHWRTREAMLRTSFPVAVHAEDAAFDIQFGHLRRPTHRNTTWDLAKDEVAGHKWVDLSQRDYGVALLNDSKYGHKVKGSVIDLNLLRSVPYPGYNTAIQTSVPPGQPHPGYTDQADHIFSYALYPHPGDLMTGKVVQAGYEFNIPLRQVTIQPHPGYRPAQAALFTLDQPNIIVEAVKKAEDDQAMIIRMYESSHASAAAKLQFGFPVTSVEETNLMEALIKPLRVKDNAVVLNFEPFEIKTVKVKG
ncbi:MAG: alpha-mannosidase, partial [Chloroflexi bacterium]